MRVDTIRVEQAHTDTVFVAVEIPIERKTYQTEDYKAEIEGFRASLVTLKATGQIIGRDHATVKWGLSRYDELEFTKNPTFLEMLEKIDGKA